MPPAHPSRHAFALRLAALTALALVGRVVFALVAGYEAEGTLSDSLNYHLLGENLAQGRGYIRAFDWAISGVRVPTAEFPPVLPLVIAGLHLLGIDTVQGQEVALAAVGAATVALVGLLAREIAGARVGLVAAALAAAYPMLVLPDATLQAEGVYGLLVNAVLLLVVRWRASRSPRDWLAVGGLVGLATLTRSEAFLLVPLVVAPLALRRGMRDALRPVALAGLGLLAVVAPWTVRNAVELDHLIPLSNNRGTLLAGANCDRSWQGDRRGLWSFECTLDVPSTGRDEVARTGRYVDAGTTYVREHVGELPGVAAVRVLRTFGLWAPGQQLDEEAREGRSEAGLRAGYSAYLLLAAAAVVGSVVGLRSRLPVAPLFGTIVLVVLTAAVSYGNQRFRMAAEPSIVVLAALGLTAAWSQLTGRGRDGGRA